MQMSMILNDSRRFLCRSGVGIEEESLAVEFANLVGPIMLRTDTVSFEVERLYSLSHRASNILLDSLRDIRLRTSIVPDEESGGRKVR